MHHIIPRSQGGNSNKINLAPLCRFCHYQIHSGTNSQLRNKILQKCYQQIKQDLYSCYKGRIIPKIVHLLEENY